MIIKAIKSEKTYENYFLTTVNTITQTRNILAGTDNLGPFAAATTNPFVLKLNEKLSTRIGRVKFVRVSRLKDRIRNLRAKSNFLRQSTLLKIFCRR